MDANGAKPPQEAKDLESMMREMMGKMCRSGNLGPAEMCERMMRSMGSTSEAEPSSAPGSGRTSDDRGSSTEEEAHRGCCGPPP